MNTGFIAVLATALLLYLGATNEIQDGLMLVIVAFVWIGWFFTRNK